MNRSKVTVLVVGALVAGLTIGGMSIANAADRTAQPATTPYSTATAMGSTSPVATLAGLTGLSVQDIQALRAQGKSLSTIATDNGVDPAAVVDQTVAARQTYLDTLVAAGRITAAQEAALLENIRAAVQAIVDATPATPGVPSTTATQSASPTHAVDKGHRRSYSRSGINAPAAAGLSGGAVDAGRVPCRNYVAPAAPSTPVSGVDQSATTNPTDSSSAPGESWSGMMGPRGGTGGVRGNGSYGW